MNERLTQHVRWREQHRAEVAADPRWQYLKSHWPPGVPAEEPTERCSLCGVSVEAHERAYPLGCSLPGTEWDEPWPATFGDYDAEGRAVHWPGRGRGANYCFQCLGCRWWCWQRGEGDWGECRAKAGPYYRRQVWEHYTCGEFRGRKR